MARPKKDNAEFFPHVVHMRNDDKIKALRRKFKLQGYAIYNMLIEYLAGKDNFHFEYNAFTLELIAGDFDAEVKDIQEIISYCLTLDLLQNENGFIRCRTLVNKLEPLLSKRKRDRERVIAGENPHSKGEKSKVKKSKGEIYTKIGEGDFFVAVKAKYAGEKPKRIYQLEVFFEQSGQLKQLQDAGFTGFREFIKTNPGRVYNDDDHVYSSFKKFCIDNPKAKARSPDKPFAEAEYNKSIWTEVAWMDKYAKQIKTDKAFQEHFKITTQ
jgi:hypothetical protein